MVAKEFGVQPRYRILRQPMLKIGGWFDTTIHELHEVLCQYDSEYLFDSTKFAKKFDFTPTSYAEGIRMTTIRQASSERRRRRSSVRSAKNSPT
jgi:hypothetical protein